MPNARRIADDFEDIQRRMRREPITNNPILWNCNCGHPENHAICDRWDCITQINKRINPEALTGKIILMNGDIIGP